MKSFEAKVIESLFLRQSVVVVYQYILKHIDMQLFLYICISSVCLLVSPISAHSFSDFHTFNIF